MKKYQVTFVATYEATIEIAAPDRDKAMERAEYLLNAEGAIYPEHMTYHGTKSDMTDPMIDGYEAKINRDGIPHSILPHPRGGAEGTIPKDA